MGNDWCNGLITMGKITCVDARGKEYTFEENMYIERPSVYGICIVDGKILLTKDIWSMQWGIPGGGIDKNETAFEALQREFLEETGLKISSDLEKLLSDITYFLGDREAKPWKTIRTVYKVKFTGGLLKKNGTVGEIAEVSYFPLNKAVELLSAKKNNLAIAKLLKTLI